MCLLVRIQLVLGIALFDQLLCSSIRSCGWIPSLLFSSVFQNVALDAVPPSSSWQPVCRAWSSVVGADTSSSSPLLGYRFETTDYSRNLWVFGLVSLGEGFHNNHHYDPSSARHGFVWWEIDVAWYVLKCLNWLGLVWDLKTPNKWEKKHSWGSSER